MEPPQIDFELTTSHLWPFTVFFIFVHTLPVMTPDPMSAKEEVMSQLEGVFHHLV